MRSVSRYLLPFLLAATLVSAATPPPLVNYQGVLRDATDQPLSGSFEMTFHFFDAEAAGGEILVDAHLGVDAVSVDGGLFNVTLGSGALSDGAGVFANDPYTSLAEVFQDFSEVWLEIEIEGETLVPRTRVVAAAYALNASQLGGFVPGDFLDTSANPQVKQGPLTLGGLDVEGNIRLTSPFFSSVYFADGGDPQAEALRWDGADHVFEATAGMQFDGALMVGDTANIPLGFNRFSTGSNPAGAGFDAPDDLYLGGSFEADGTAYFSGEIFVDNDGPDGDQHLWFFNDGSPAEELKWDETAERFEFSDALAIAGSLRTGQTQGAPEGFNHLGDLGKVPDSDDMSGPQDLYIEGDLEVEERTYLGGELVMLDYGPDADGDGSAGDDVDQWIFFYDDGTMDDEWLSWENNAGGGVDRFEFSDSLHVFGDLTALNKNFVQNHPERDDLELVYTSLEGDEAAVFTRGHARLLDGQARVRLEETFAWVAHPDIGLTAHLTPRGQSADLYVESLTPDELVVRSDSPGAADIGFDFIVFGLRLGYETQPVVRPRGGDAPLPAVGTWDGVYAEVPGARRLSPDRRYERMSEQALGRVVPAGGSDRAISLRAAIGQRDRERPERDRGSTPAAEDGAEQVRGPRGAGPAATSQPSRGVHSDETAANLADDVGSRSESASRTEAPPAMRARSFVAERAGIASVHPASENLQPGDVVVLDPTDSGAIRRADRAEDPTVIGVTTAEAGVVVTAREGSAGDGGVPVALSGIVPCKVDASYGEILPGDLLVTSPTPGHAMRRQDPIPGTVLGKALESLATGTDTILVLIVQH